MYIYKYIYNMFIKFFYIFIVTCTALFKDFSSDLIRSYARFMLFYFCRYVDLLFSEDT